MEVVSRYGSSGAWGARANFDAKQRKNVARSLESRWSKSNKMIGTRLKKYTYTIKKKATVDFARLLRHRGFFGFERCQMMITKIGCANRADEFF